VAPDHRGNGYATEAARVMVELRFRKLKLHRVSSQRIIDSAPRRESATPTADATSETTSRRLDHAPPETVELSLGCKMTTYAIVQTGGKQYQVRPGDTIRVESLPQEQGENVELSDVLMVSADGEVTLGTPNVTGAKVTAEVAGHGKGKKVIVFKYKSKTRYRRKQGHRQSYTDLAVTGITVRKS
jgi:large subunit ribosomal protein L21